MWVISDILCTHKMIIYTIGYSFLQIYVPSVLNYYFSTNSNANLFKYQHTHIIII